jgi:hypothetical protein
VPAPALRSAEPENRVTLVDASHTPDQPTHSEPRDSEAGSTKIPWRAKLSLLRQRIILTIRWWFRLPIDDIKEQHTQAQIDGLVALAQQQNDTIKTLVRISNQMQARLIWYERHVPRMRDLKREFDREQARLAVETNGESIDASNGILPVKRPIVLSS